MEKKQDMHMDEDVKVLHSMGYSQELARRMGGFQNFAISFSIICILAGGITAFPLSLSAAGGASVGLGWPLASFFAIMVALALGQVASAYPTAGGIYHWASMLGNKGWGWAAAWFNLLGLLFVVSSVNFGLYLLFKDLFVAGVLGVDVSGWGWWTQTLFITGATLIQAWINHTGIKLTTTLTDFSGYLILAGAIVLTAALLYWAPSLDFSRLFTFTNFSGEAGGSVWPNKIEVIGVIFLLGLLQGVYTITGFDASGHTSEETRSAAIEVPKGMWRSVFYSFLFGYIMICSFVLAMPSVEEGAAQGWNAFPWLMAQSPMPTWLKDVLVVVIVIANFLCALAGLTSTSRMMFAFARDGGLPFSSALRKVSHKHRTPSNAIWWGAILSIVATLYGDAFVVLSTGCAVFLYISYVMPIAAGLINEGKKWDKKGPFDLKGLSKPIALIAVIGCLILVWVGIQPPNEKVGYLVIALAVFLFVVWYVGERKRFQGPPTGDMIKMRQAEIAREEAEIMKAE